MLDIKTHIDEAGVAWVRLEREARRNALTIDMRVHLGETFAELGADTSVRAVVLCASGDTFCAGADLEQFGKEGPAEARARMKRGGINLIKQLYHLEKPVIAAVNGLLYTARFLDAEEALRLHLANTVVPADELEKTVAEIATDLAQAPTFSLGLMKTLMHKTAESGLDAFLETELLVPPQLRHTVDYAEGIAAFKEKRKPVFRGN